ncbi:hypothetical protein C8J57DRAFT_1542276 [Mycena rebaudengoi]|nr:hypothetical protein C8J57DRAFT_1542276 [Mycena rebaudengoi]
MPTSSMPLRLPPLPSRTYAVPSIPSPNFSSVPPLSRRLLPLPFPSTSLPMSHALPAAYTPPAPAGNAGVVHLILFAACVRAPPLHVRRLGGARVRAPTSRRVRHPSSCAALLFR